MSLFTPLPCAPYIIDDTTDYYAMPSFSQLFAYIDFRFSPLFAIDTPFDVIIALPPLLLLIRYCYFYD